MKKAGIFIILLGLGLTVFTAFTSFTREKVVDIADFELSRSEPKYLNWSPLVGIAIMGFGLVVYMLPSKNN